MTGFSLSGKQIFLSGAAGHLGRAMARGLAGAGAELWLNDRAAAPLADLAAELRAGGARVHEAVFDITDRAATDGFFAARERLDGLVNNAIGGLGHRSAGLAMIESGVVAAAENITAALPALRAAAQHSGQASVVNITSIWGSVAPPFPAYHAEDALTPPGYGIAKGGLLQLSRYLACQLGPEGIRVNSLSPGLFPWDSVIAERPGFAARMAGRTPLQRNGRAPEIAGALVFLLSEAASFVTGTELRVDGGYTAW